MRASWLMPAESATPRMPRGAIAGPAFFQSKRRAATCGCATYTEPTQNCAGLAQAEIRQAFQEAHLLALRTALIGTARHLRKQHREVSTCDAQLRAVTNACLAQGGQ